MRTYLKGIMSALVIVIAVACAQAVSASHLTGSGCSVSKEGYLTELAKEYERRTGVKVFIRGGGSLVGVAELKTGKVDFAASCSNRLADDQDGIEFIQVAWDALVFIVHKSNGVDNISHNEIKDVYSGKITDWKMLNGREMPIKLFVSRPGMRGLSGIEASFREFVLRDQDVSVAPNAIFNASAGIIEQMVEKTPDGFGITGFSSARKRDVKMLKVNGVPPTRETIAKGKYPYRRPLFIVVKKNPDREVKKFIDFILSKEGQHFIGSQGVVSLLDVK